MKVIATLIAAGIALAATSGCAGGEDEDEARSEQQGGEEGEDD